MVTLAMAIVHVSVQSVAGVFFFSDLFPLPVCQRPGRDCSLEDTGGATCEPVRGEGGGGEGRGGEGEGRGGEGRGGKIKCIIT